MESPRDVRSVDTELIHYRLGWLVTVGFGLIAVGMTALYAPYYSSFSLQNLIGSFFLIGGGMFVADAFWARREGRFVPELSIGLLYLLFALLVGYAGGEIHDLTLILAILLGLEGILKIFFSFRLRPESGWTWALSSGVVSVIICAAIWGVPPGTPLVSVMVGIDLLHSGLATIMIANAMRKTLEMHEILCIGNVCFSG